MQTVIVTGADRGIGEALCMQLHRRGERVIAACLDDSPSLRALGIEVANAIDVTLEQALERLAAQLGHRSLDLLIHNAGRVIERPLGELAADALLSEYAVNAVAPLCLTQALLGRMREGSKIALVTSRVGSLGENQSGGLYGYRMSKAAANMAGLNLAHDLRQRGIAVICLHPGTVRTQMTAGLTDTQTMGLLVEPDDAARGLIARIDELTLETTGSFRHANGQALPW